MPAERPPDVVIDPRIFSGRRAPFATARQTPRKRWRSARETVDTVDEANQIIDELSLEAVI
jgi:hypothetical protein